MSFLLSQVERYEGPQERSQFTAVDLLRTPQMRRRALILFYIWWDYSCIDLYIYVSSTSNNFIYHFYLRKKPERVKDFIFLLKLRDFNVVLFVIWRSHLIMPLSFILAFQMAIILMFYHGPITWKFILTLILIKVNITPKIIFLLCVISNQAVIWLNSAEIICLGYMKC